MLLRVASRTRVTVNPAASSSRLIDWASLRALASFETLA